MAFESDEAQCERASCKTSPTRMCAIKQNCHYLLILNATFSLPEQSQPVNTHALPWFQQFNHLCVLPLFVFLCQQVLRGRQVFPKKQHDFVSNGLWGGPAEWELWDTGSIVGTSWQQQSAPHFTHEMDVLLHLEKDKRLSACLQYFLRPLYQSLRTLL